jgi:hypothetical protein
MNAVEVARRLDRVRLKDGSEVGIRPLEAVDREALTALDDRLSQHARYQRFFACAARQRRVREETAQPKERQGVAGVSTRRAGTHEASVHPRPAAYARQTTANRMGLAMR